MSIRKVNDSANHVYFLNDYILVVNGKHYEIVGPTERLFDDLEYVDYDGALWVKI